jgi:hypothetical protein
MDTSLFNSAEWFRGNEFSRLDIGIEAGLAVFDGAISVSFANV